MPEPVVEIHHVSFGYPPQPLLEPVLDDVSLTIESREFLGIIGPNGGGKTTLLKIMLGLLKPVRGTVLVFGRPPVEARNRIGYVPQHARIDASVPASVLDVVLTGRLGRSSWGPTYGRQHVEAARAALRQTATDDLAHRTIGTLSGGQRQRVLIARALAADAQLLLLDEPTAGVDAHMERGLTDLLHRLNDTLPIVIVSHDVSFVSSHLKRVACLNRRLTCHAANSVTWETIAPLYHGPMRAVHHQEDCPLTDPGCHHGCGEGGGGGRWAHLAKRKAAARRPMRPGGRGHDPVLPRHGRQPLFGLGPGGRPAGQPGVRRDRALRRHPPHRVPQRRHRPRGRGRDRRGPVPQWPSFRSSSNGSSPCTGPCWRPWPPRS